MRKAGSIFVTMAAAALTPGVLRAADPGWLPPACTAERFSPEGSPPLPVSSTNRPPRISGIPPVKVRAGQDYVFLPSVTDADNDRLQFFIANQPAWLEFNREWGTLSGIPDEDDAGVYPNVSVSVTDGRSAPVSLPPFTITVTGTSGALPAAARKDRVLEPLYNGVPLGSWVRTLETGSLPEKRRALQVVTALGPEAAPAAPALIRIVSNPFENALLRSGAALALGRLGAPGREAVPALIRYLLDGSPLAVEAATEALGHLGEPAAVPFLANVLDRPESQLRRKAADALGAIGPGAFEAVPSLIRSLKAGNETAAEALGRIGEPGSVPSLIDALSDWRVAFGAVSALGAIGPEHPGILPALVRTVSLPQAPEAVRVRAAEVLGSFGQKAKDAVPALVSLLKGPHSAAIRSAAAQALMSISTEKESGLPILVWALGESPDPNVRRWAAEMIGRLGPAAFDAVPALVKALEDPDPAVRQEAEKSIRRLQGKLAGGPGTARNNQVARAKEP